MENNLIQLWLIGSSTYLLRSIPEHIWGLIRKKISVTVQIDSYDELYETFTDWFEKQNLQVKTHVLEANYCNKRPYYKMTLGTGRHFFKFGNDRFYISRRKKEDSQGYGSIPEEISITSFGLSRAPMTRLFASVVKNKEITKTKIYLWNDKGWSHVMARTKRSLESLHLSENVWQKIKNHLDNFDKRKDYFEDNGIPYKTGMCFYGPPGTGKTSLVFALAGMLDRSIYILTLAGMTDQTLAKAIQGIGTKGILLIEDIDSFGSTQVREHGSDSKEEKLSLSAILQALDGYLSPMGTIMIITTNHPEALDPAIKRDGRIDLMLELGNWDALYAKELALKLNLSIQGDIPLNPSKFINHMNVH